MFVALSALSLDLRQHAGAPVHLEKGLVLAACGVLDEIGYLNGEGWKDKVLVECERAVVVRLGVNLCCGGCLTLRGKSRGFRTRRYCLSSPSYVLLFPQL